MYLIHPLWFYLYGLLNNLIIAFAILIILSAGSALFNGVAYADDAIKVNKERALKRLKISSVSFIFFGFLLVAIPSQQTMLQMAAASFATKENMSTLVHNGKLVKDEFKNDLLEVIKTIKEKSK